MKKLLILFAFTPLFMNAQTLVDSCEAQYFQFTTIEYNPTTFETEKRRILTAEYKGEVDEFQAVDENGDIWILKKKKKRNSDSQINVQLSEGYPGRKKRNFWQWITFKKENNYNVK